MGIFHIFASCTFAFLFLACILPECSHGHSQLETNVTNSTLEPLDAGEINQYRRLVNAMVDRWIREIRDIVGCKLYLNICHACQPNYVDPFTEYVKQRIPPFMTELKALFHQKGELNHRQVMQLWYRSNQIYWNIERAGPTCPRGKPDPKDCAGCVRRWADGLATQTSSELCPACPLCVNEKTRRIVGYTHNFKGAFSNRSSSLQPPKEWSGLDSVMSESLERF